MPKSEFLQSFSYLLSCHSTRPHPLQHHAHDSDADVIADRNDILTRGSLPQAIGKESIHHTPQRNYGPWPLFTGSAAVI